MSQFLVFRLQGFNLSVLGLESLLVLVDKHLHFKFELPHLFDLHIFRASEIIFQLHGYHAGVVIFVKFSAGVTLLLEVALDLV